MNATICDAIASLQRLYVTYDGYVRLVEPHAYGVTRENKDVMRVWQVAGGSVHGEPAGWKLLRLDEAFSIRAAGEAFQEPRPGYKRGDTAMRYIYAQL